MEKVVKENGTSSDTGETVWDKTRDWTGMTGGMVRGLDERGETGRFDWRMRRRRCEEEM